MEICLKLYDAFLALKDLNNVDYKYASLSINRAHIVNMSMSVACRNDILDMKKEVCLKMMEDKLVMMNVLGSSLGQGSPLHKLPLELRFVDNTGKYVVLMCALQEFPQCCGSLVLSPFMTGEMFTLDKWKVVSSFMGMALALARICSYSNVVYILSKVDNAEIYEFIDLIKQQYSDTHLDFTNNKTSNLCSILTKNL